MRQLTGAGVVAAAACALTAVVLANVPAAGHSTPPVASTTKPAHRVVRVPPRPAVPYYVAITGGAGIATVRRTATGARIATVPAPRGATFFGVAAAGDDRTFVLAARTSSADFFYRLRLSAQGVPGRLALIPVAPLPRHFGSCPAELAGLAVSPGGRLLAISLLSNCPNGRAGASEILSVRLDSGRTLAAFHPGDGYPMWLSWTAAGSLAYSWTGTSTGVFIIPDARAPGSSPQLLISSSASVDGFSGADFPMITPDGSAVIVSVARGSLTFAVAEFSAHGTARWLLTPPVRNPVTYCGPLWTDASGQHLLTGCGDNSEYYVRDRHLTRLRDPWKLPFYAVPGAPLIGW